MAVTKHGEWGTRLYHTWGAMIQRCHNPKDSRYPNYGGRGIRVCQEWADYPVFAEWARANGYDDSLSIDRIDNDKGYSPENCQWIPFAENAGKSRYKEYTFFGETKTLAQWQKDPRCTVSLATVYNRLIMRYSIEEALFTPRNKL